MEHLLAPSNAPTVATVTSTPKRKYSENILNEKTDSPLKRLRTNDWGNRLESPDNQMENGSFDYKEFYPSITMTIKEQVERDDWWMPPSSPIEEEVALALPNLVPELPVVLPER